MTNLARKVRSSRGMQDTKTANDGGMVHKTPLVQVDITHGMRDKAMGMNHRCENMCKKPLGVLAGQNER